MKVIDYQTTIAWRCPHCGRLDMDIINIFDFSGQQRLTMECKCDFSKVTVSKKNKNNYCLEYYCLLCETKHVQVYHKREFWESDLKKVKCSTHEVELGYLGEHDDIKELVIEEEEYLKKARDKLKIDDYVQKPNINQENTEKLEEKNSLRKLKKIKILEGVVRALQKPPLKS